MLIYKFLLIKSKINRLIEFKYNNSKNLNINFIAFEFDYVYHFCIFYRKGIDS